MTALASTQRPAPQAARYLIGPQIYPAFAWTLRVSLIVLAVGFGVWLIASVLNFAVASGMERYGKEGKKGETQGNRPDRQASEQDAGPAVDRS